MNGDIENFEEVTAKGEELYKTFSPVRCPYFEGDVHFNAAGLEHLKFKRPRYARPRHDQYMRFKLLSLVPEVLRLSHTVQGIWETKHFERVRIHSRTDTILKPVTYYEFIAVIKRVRIKIVIKQIEDGQRFFWSIIPYFGELIKQQGVVNCTAEIRRKIDKINRKPAVEAGALVVFGYSLPIAVRGRTLQTPI